MKSYQTSEISRILEEDIGFWDKEFQKKEKKTKEDAKLGKRTSNLVIENLDESSDPSNITITMEDLVFMLRNNPKYEKSEILLKACTKSLF